LTDNGSAYVSGELRKYLGDRRMARTRGAPYHPQTQGKIERYHESLDNVTPADVYFGRQYAVLTGRDKIKRLTMKRRKKEYFAAKVA
jgi:putative transposase